MGGKIFENLCYLMWDVMLIPELRALSPRTDHPSALQYVSFVVSIVTCIIGFAANIIVIFVTGFLMKKNKYKIWFLNLALADFAFLLFLPLHAASVIRGKWPYGSTMCKSYNFLSFVNMYASIYILTALNIDRALSVAKPIWHRKFYSKRFCWCMCAVIWVSSILCSIPAIIYSDVHEESPCTLSAHDPIRFTNMLSSSLVHFDYNSVDNEYDGYEYDDEISFSRERCKNISDTFPLVFSSLFAAMWREMTFTATRLVVPVAVFGYAIPLCVILSSNIIIALREKNSKRASSSRLYRVVSASVLSFFCTRTPYICAYITFLTSIFTLKFTLMYKVSIVLPLLSTIAATNSFLNPVVYVLIGVQVRSEIMNFLGRRRFMFANVKKRDRERKERERRERGESLSLHSHL